MSKRAMRLATLSLALGALMWLLLAQLAATQETAAVSGVVVELGGGPVDGVIVRQ